MIRSALPTPPARSRGRALLIALAAALALVVGLLAARGILQDSVEYQAASMYPQSPEVRPFELTDADGNAFTENDLHGDLTLLFFGFTNCPDVCPDTLATLAEAMDKLETMRVERLPEVVFVSVDPARDGGESMRDYVTYFDPAFRAVTGSDDALQTLTRQMGVMYARERPDDSGYYGVDHSGMIVVVDSRGRMIGRFPPSTDAERVAADLFKLSRSGA
jgi:protein SCO1/2